MSHCLTCFTFSHLSLVLLGFVCVGLVWVLVCFVFLFGVLQVWGVFLIFTREF